MISFKDLLLHPDEYKPLSSHKSVFNKANDPSYVDVDLKSQFTAIKNQGYLARNLHKIAADNGNHARLEKFQALIKVAQKEFCKINDINEYYMAEQEAQGIRDWVELLRCVNNDFLKYCYKLLRWNNFNPYREKTEVGPADNRVTKNYRDLLAHEISTIDVYDDYQIERYNRQFYLENKIPAWQVSIHTRNYDTNPGGYRNGEQDRASLENPIYEYNMGDIYELVDKWKNKDWFGL